MIPSRASGHIPEDTLNTYCWIHATYTVPAALWKVAGRQVAYPGVANSKDTDGTVKHVKYYQWVAFMLFFQVSATANGTYILQCDLMGNSGTTIL